MPAQPLPSPPPVRSIADAAGIADAINAELHAQVVRVGRVAPPAALSSGYPALDAATGLGGLPRGRITQIVGRPTSGRETVATRAVAASEGPNAWVDVRGLVDVDYLDRAGVDLGRLFILRPEAPLDALAIAAHVIASGRFGAVVLDSLADLPPGPATTRAIEQFIRVVTPVLGKSATVCVVLSGPDGDDDAIRHAAALRIWLVKVSFLRPGGVLRGWRTCATILKSTGRQLAECRIEVWL